VRDGIGDPLLVGHGRVDLEGHLSVGPTELAARDDDSLGDCFSTHSRIRPLDFLDAAEVDIALEDAATIDDGVLQRFLAERQAGDDGRPDLLRTLQLGVVVGIAFVVGRL
jgi:hypothetical protein